MAVTVNSLFTTAALVMSDDLTPNSTAGLQVPTINATLGINLSEQVDHASYARCSLYDFTVEGILMGILCIFGFIGNTLSVLCLWREKSKTATPFLLISLEVADTFFLVNIFIVRVLHSFAQYLQWQGVSLFIARIGMYIYPCAFIALTATIYLTLLVTANRFISVCRPYDAVSLCSINHARRHVVVVALFSVLYCLPRFFEYKVIYTYDSQNETIPTSEESDLVRNRYYQIVYMNILYFTIMFLVPLSTLVGLNYRLVVALNKTRQRRRKLLRSAEAGPKSEDDITLMLIFVVAIFVICQTPALITQILYLALPAHSDNCPRCFFFYVRLSDLLVVANSATNFLIYCFCSRKFRSILCELVCHTILDNGSPEKSSANGQVGCSSKGAKTRYTTVADKEEIPPEDTAL